MERFVIDMGRIEVNKANADLSLSVSMAEARCKCSLVMIQILPVDGKSFVASGVFISYWLSDSRIARAKRLKYSGDRW